MSDHGHLPPGTRFYPTEDELLEFYLPNKLQNTRTDIELVIPVVDVYSFDPSQLPSMSGEANRRDPEQWFFFCPRQEREAQGGRPTRTTPSGYWKATVSPSCVYSRSTGQIIGMKKTMVFYAGRAPTGTKTVWKMNEYKAVEDHQNAARTAAGAAAPPRLRNEFTLCRMYTSTGTLTRSFDRRPPDAVEASRSRQVTDYASSSRNNANRPVVEGTSSLGGGDDGGSQSGVATEEAIDWDALENLEWDLSWG